MSCATACILAPLLSHTEIRDHSQSALCQRQDKTRDLHSVGANEQKLKLVERFSLNLKGSLPSFCKYLSIKSTVFKTKKKIMKCKNKGKKMSQNYIE